MRLNSQFPVDLVSLTEEILTGKLHFLYIVVCSDQIFDGTYEEELPHIINI